MGLFPAVPTLSAELAAWRRGLRVVAGVDEAGCGPLAGPVVAAAVVLDPGAGRTWWCEFRDSKQLAPEERERLSALIRGECVHGIGVASHAFIDEHGLTEARKHAMREAVAALPHRPQILLIDAMRLPEYRHRAIIHGDAIVASIAAASIVAKVARDAMMTQEHETYPQYGFNAHKGYSTPEHKRALEEHGPCAIHRRLFAPVRAALVAHGLPVPALRAPLEAGSPA
jgi:ribonuclease HII